jgi:hypothetical protein
MRAKNSTSMLFTYDGEKMVDDVIQCRFCSQIVTPVVDTLQKNQISIFQKKLCDPAGVIDTGVHRFSPEFSRLRA